MAENHLKNALTGFIMGAISFLPGVSGGFVAMIAGIYERFVDAVGDPKKWLKEFVFLATVGGFMIVGMFAASKVIEKVYDEHQVEILFFFLGLIALQLPDVFDMAMEKKTERKITPWEVVLFVIGFAIMAAFMFKINIYDGSVEHNVYNFALATVMGAIVGTSKVVPGLSWATVFLAIGVYTFKVYFVSNLDWFFIVGFGIGFVIGIIIFSKIMDTLIKKYHSQTYFLIFGIVVASLPVIFNSIPIGKNEDWLIGILFLAIGAVVGRIISVYARKIRAQSVCEQ